MQECVLLRKLPGSLVLSLSDLFEAVIPTTVSQQGDVDSVPGSVLIYYTFVNLDFLTCQQAEMEWNDLPTSKKLRL